MKTSRIWLVVTTVLLAFAAQAYGAGVVPSGSPTISRVRPGATWTVTVYGPKNEQIGALTIRLTDKPAVSCMAGDWKQIEVLKSDSAERNFIATRPLSYSINGEDIIFGANEICDLYLWLHGHLDASGMSGDYVALGLGGAQSLGTFKATPVDARSAPN